MVPPLTVAAAECCWSRCRLPGAVPAIAAVVAASAHDALPVPACSAVQRHAAHCSPNQTSSLQDLRSCSAGTKAYPASMVGTKASEIAAGGQSDEIVRLYLD